MAKYLGAVRFGDGKLAWFIWNGTADLARPRLCTSMRRVCSSSTVDSWSVWISVQQSKKADLGRSMLLRPIWRTLSVAWIER